MMNFPPLIPAKAGTQRFPAGRNVAFALPANAHPWTALGPRFRGDERIGVAVAPPGSVGVSR
jgi:hypothetical protein